MILTANSERARQTARRRTANGWITSFIGENRNTLQPGTAPPAPGTLYPMAFLVEKEPHAVVKPHFHAADQYQVVVQGGGRVGVHDVGFGAVHYTDAWSAYGPIVAADDGIAWFTLRNSWDPGAQYMPGAREQLRAARARNHQHRESTAALPQTDASACLPLIGQGTDGLATWRYRLPAGASVAGPDPSAGGGQVWVVLSGSISATGSAPLPPNSCIFVAPADAPLALTAATADAAALCLQFPRLARH